MKRHALKKFKPTWKSTRSIPCPFVRPHEKSLFRNKKSIALFALSLLSATQAGAQTNTYEVYSQEFSFTLNNIEYNENSSIQSSSFADKLLEKYQNKTVTLQDIQSIKNQIQGYYNQELSIPQIRIVMRLPNLENGVLGVSIQEPLKYQKKEPLNLPIIQAVQFSGNITINPQEVLAIANVYTNKPYSLVQALSLRKKLKELYGTKNISSSIDLPEFDSTTGDLYIHIEEGSRGVLALDKEKETSPSSLKTQNSEIAKFEVSKDIFMFKPAPKNWQEPAWLTAPQKVVPTKTAPIQNIDQAKPLKETLLKVKQGDKGKVSGKIPTETIEKPIISQIQPPIGEGFFTASSRERTEFIKSSDGFTLVNRSDDDLLLLELVIDGYALNNAIAAYYDYTTDELFIPLGMLSETLNFPMDINSTQGQMKGFFLSPNNTFYLDGRNKTINIQEQAKLYPEAGLEFSNTEVYATPEIIQKWFPLDVKMIYSEQRLELTSKTDLPYKAFAKRRNIWEQIKDKNKPNETDSSTQDLEKKWLSNPHAYAALKQNFTKTQEDKYTSNSNINIQATADVLQMTGYINANISHQSSGAVKIDEVKATLTQLDSSKNLLGVLNASQVELGDVNYQIQPLLRTNSSGRGLFITNKAINAIRDPDNFILTGNAPAGWDVEIYQNGLILDFQTVNANGTYAFTALPLKKGENIFNVEIFGPSGEKKEYTESYFLGQDALKKGEFNYDFIATESSDNLINTEDALGKDGLVSLSAEYGLFENFSVMGGLFSGEIYNEEQEAITTGIRTAFWGTDIQADYITQSDEAKAYQLQVRRSLGKNTSVNFSYQNFSGYDLADNPTESIYATTLNKTFTFDYIPNIETQIRLEHEELLIGESRQNLKTKVGTRIGSLYLTNDLDVTYKENAEDLYSGTFSLTSRFDKFDIRARTSYQLSPSNSSINQFNIGANGKVSKTLTMRGDMTQNFDKGLDTTAFNSQLSWKVKQADIGFNLGGTSEGDVTVGFNLSTNLAREESGYMFKNSQNAAFGGVQANIRAFLDDNNNLIYDENEEILPNVLFHYKKRGRVARTNDKGVASLKGLSPYVDNMVSVDLLSIKDIYIKPVNEQMNIIAEPNQAGFIEFPMRFEGEIGGIIEYSESDNLQPFSGVRLSLKNKQGEVVAKSLSEFDGYFIFTGVPMGEHTIHINTEDMNSTSSEVTVVKPTEIKLSKNMPYTDGYKLLVTAVNSKPSDIINQSLKNMQTEELQKSPTVRP